MSIFYQQGMEDAFVKLGLSAAALHQLANSNKSIGLHALGGAALGAGGGYAASGEGHGLRGALVGGALGGAAGVGTGVYRDPLMQHARAIKGSPFAESSYRNALQAHAAGPEAYEKALTAHRDLMHKYNDPRITETINKLHPPTVPPAAVP